MIHYLTEVVCFYFSLPKAEKTRLIFHGISDLAHNRNLCFFNRDIFFNPEIFLFITIC